MECKEAEDLYAEYILGALDSGDRYRVEAHLAFCRECNLNIQGDGETVAAIALGAPPLEAPQRIKRRLLAAVRAEMEAGQTVPTRVGLGTLVAGFFRGTYAHAGKAMAGAVVVGLVAAGVWFNARLDQIARDQVALSSEMGQMAEQEAEVALRVDKLNEKNEQMGEDLDVVVNWGEHVDGQLATVSRSTEEFIDMMNQQRFLSYMSTYVATRPSGRVNMLTGADATRHAYGMIMCCRTIDGETTALLSVYNLAPLPRDQVYQVWLLKDDQRYSGGVFTVDSTGFGLGVVIPAAPLTEFDAIGITVEPAQGSGGPTGTHVLTGEF
jgi:anti-sigma-K factor RskA